MSIGGITKILAIFDLVATESSGTFTGVDLAPSGSPTGYDTETLTGVKSSRVSVSLCSDNAYAYGLSTYDEIYDGMAGTDLSSLFFPFHAGASGKDGYTVQMPTMSGLDQEVNSGDILAVDLLPFFFDMSGSVISTVEDATKEDSLHDVVTGTTYPLNMHQVRDVRDIRSLGMRTPMILVGWGYDVDGLPVPYGSGDNTFKGEVERGCLVDPKDYIAAPLDVRYNPDRHVWEAGGMSKHRHLVDSVRDGGPAFASFFADDLAEASGLGYHLVVPEVFVLGASGLEV